MKLYVYFFICQTSQKTAYTEKSHADGKSKMCIRDRTERNSGHTSFDKTGATDSGNTYTLKYRDGLVSLAIVCSEVDPTASSAQEQAAEEAAQEAPQEQTPASSVILAGTPKEENAQ